MGRGGVVKGEGGHVRGWSEGRVGGTLSGGYPEWYEESCQLQLNQYNVIIIYSIKLQVSILILLGIAGLSSVFLIATNASYYLLVVSKCNNNSRDDYTYENTTSDHPHAIDIPASILGAVLQVILYFLFARDVVYRGILKHEDYIGKFCGVCTVKRFLVSLVLSAAIATSVAEAILSHYRDVEYVNSCDNEAVQNYHALQLLFALHAAAKAFSYFYMLVISFSSINIFYSSSVLWKEGIKSMCKCKVSFEDNNIVVKTSRTKLYDLYVNYIKVGTKISLQCNALRQWFLMMYLVSFIYLLLDLTHITQPRGTLSIAATVVNIVIYGVAFFAPYSMAFRLNKNHEEYHKKFMDSYQGLEIVMGSNKYEFTPGSSPVVSKNDEEEQTWGDVGELSLLLRSKEGEVGVETQTEEACLEEKYKEYFNEVPKSLILAKVAAFDFVPLLMYLISIPLDSLMHTFTVITSLLSFAIISGLVDKQS